MNRHNYRPGFTIAELLVVIVIIAILVTLALVAYSGISQKAIGASLQSDLKNASSQIKAYNAENGSYPTSNNCTGGTTPTPPKICLKSSAGNSYGFSYSANNTTSPQTFTLKATNGATTYVVTENTVPTLFVYVPLVCPSGFVVVPGSGTYGTSDFCTMKYEAKRVGATTTPISEATGLPWTNLSQSTAISNSQNVAGCIGCHLITEAEWMTIAQNVLSVPSNWSGGSLGNGYIYSGHNNGLPALLAADSNDTNGYSGTGVASPMPQRRTLTLTNGEVIWDLSGNAWEWTSGTVTTGQPGIDGDIDYEKKEWPMVTNRGTNPIDPSAAGTTIVGANTWNSDQGIGQLTSFSGEVALRGHLRGGPWSSGGGPGVLAMTLNYAPNFTNNAMGFRVSR